MEAVGYMLLSYRLPYSLNAGVLSINPQLGEGYETQKTPDFNKSAAHKMD